MIISYKELKDSMNRNESLQKLTSYTLAIDFESKERQLALQNKAKNELYIQRLQQQRLINIVFMTIIAGMFAVSIVYYRQKRKQQTIIAILEERNREISQQKANLNKLEKALLIEKERQNISREN